MPATTQPLVPETGFTRCQISAKGTGLLPAASQMRPEKRTPARCSAPLVALEALQRLPEAGEVSLYGDVLHVLTPRDDAETVILDALRAVGVEDASLAPIAPTLEDVFISLTNARASERP